MHIVRSRWQVVRSRGFTIVELLVVVAIIGVLATISIVGYSAWRQAAAATQVKNDLNALSSAMETYRTFNNGYPPDLATIASTFTANPDVTITPYSIDPDSYCFDAVAASFSGVTYYLASETKDVPEEGTCATRPTLTVPGVPTNLAITSASAAQIAMSWTASSGAASYLLQCASDAAFVNGLREATSTGITGTVTNLVASSTHFCRVKAQNGAGASSFTATLSSNTTVLVSPASVTASAINDVSFVLSWTPNTDATSFTAQCATNAGFTTGLSEISVTDPTVQFNSRVALTTYFCRVRAQNISNTSAWSSTLTVTTTATFGTIAAATGLNETSLTPATGTANWTGITCSLGSPEYRLVWVSPQTTSTAWSAAVTTPMTFVQQTTNTWRVESRCAYLTVTSSVTASANKSFTATGTQDPSGAFGTIGWNGRFQFDANANTYTCVSPAVEQYQLVSTLINTTSSTISYGWTTATSLSVTGVNQGSRMTTYIQVRCLLNSIPSNTIASSSRTDNASIDAPGSVPGWCAGSCGSPRGDRWSAVSCPAGTTGSYWAYAVGNYSNPIWGPYEATGFFGYDRPYYTTGDTMVNGYLMARCVSSYTASAYGPQSYAYY